MLSLSDNCKKKHNTCSNLKKNNKGKGKERNKLTKVNKNEEGFNSRIEILNTNNEPEFWINFEIKKKKRGQSDYINKNQSSSRSSSKLNDTTKQQLDVIQKKIQDLGKRLTIHKNKKQHKEWYPNELQSETKQSDNCDDNFNYKKLKIKTIINLLNNKHVTQIINWATTKNTVWNLRVSALAINKTSKYYFAKLRVLCQITKTSIFYQNLYILPKPPYFSKTSKTSKGFSNKIIIN
jgi:hypothetical protein